MPIWMLFAPALFLAGLVIFVRGLRGRVVDDHPLCRACGFDLFGLPAGVNTCSVCGAELSSPKSIRVGHRRRQTGMVALGAVLMLPTLFGLALAGWFAANNVKWIEQAPYWYVARQTRSTVATERDAALSEIQRRIIGNEVSAPQIKRITDDALAIQANLNATWAAGWGDVV
jgi:hypothetical protein